MHSSQTSRRPRVTLVIIAALAALLVALGANAQDDVPAEPATAEAAGSFQQTLAAAAAHSRERVRLAELERIAPYDLTWAFE